MMGYGFMGLASLSDSLQINNSQHLDSGKQDAYERHQGVMGWQSFSSDVSNHTSASSASLELLLNERQLDPEIMLASLGFGLETEGFVPSLARIPERFLRQPSKATGISLPGVGEDVGADIFEEAPQATLSGPTSSESAPIPIPAAPRKRPGISTLVKTLSMIRMKTSFARAGHMSPSRTPPLAHQPSSILLPINQKYLASKGYYRQQGWPRGTFEEAEEETQKENMETKDAATKRKHFQRMKTNRQWSLCESGDHFEESPSKESGWQSQSLDDSLSLDSTHERHDSLGTRFSTNTESSTDSLDTPNIETERAFEEIRRQYNESLVRKRSSTDDLFLPPRPKDRLSSEDRDTDNDYLNTNDIRSNNYFISPASSRQATVEKAPTISRSSVSDETEDSQKNDGNNNQSVLSKCDKGSNIGEDFSRSQYNDSSTDVRIIVSSSDNLSGRHSPSNVGYDFHSRTSGKLSVKAVQRTSSDSGSTSSSGTAIGSSSIATTTDDLDTLRCVESDRDSLSGSVSPYGFSQKPVSSHSCQTLEADFKLAATLAAARPLSSKKNGASETRQNTQIRASRSRASGTFTVLEDSPRVQLSALPTSINPLELMKKLQNSQDELSRMGSVQSDSSGFGDFDPTSETGHQEFGMLRSNKGEIATQTSLNSYSKLSGSRHQEEKDSESQVDSNTRYVTMCYIPTLGAKPAGVSQTDHKHRAVRSDHSLYLSNRSSDAGRHERLTSSRPRGFSATSHHMDYVDSPQIRMGESRSDSPKVSSVHYVQKNKTWDLRRNGLPRSQDSTPITQRKFTSNLDLYTDEAGLHAKDSREGASQRRHSNDSLLNDTPISVELAQATGGAAVNSSTSVTMSSSIFTQPSGSPIITSHTPLAGNLSRISGEGQYPPSQFKPYRRNFSQQRSCDVLEDDFSISDGDLSPRKGWLDGQDQSHIEDYHRLTGSLPPSSYAYSLPPLSLSRNSDDFETYSSVESNSDYSIQSFPEGHSRSEILDSRRLAQLINQPIFYKGKRRSSGHYRPRRLFKEWSLLSKRKRLQEENRLLQYALQKYKTELSIMETSFMIDYQTVYPEMNQEEREELEELEYLWAEVRGQVVEMEQLLLARVKSVHSGNDFHSLMSSMGIINRMIELIKEQMYLQQVASARTKDIREEDLDDMDGHFHDELLIDERQKMFNEVNHRRSSARNTHSSSLSNIPADLNLSLEQIKSSLLSQVQLEIKESTKRLELDLKEKDKEIQELKERLSQSSETPFKPVRRWTPKSARSKSFTANSSQSSFGSKSLSSTPLSSSLSRKKSRLVGNSVVQETDV
ncbi:uncharacterized protein LOC106078875 isoform X2 [Biomphalaria glabrata]|uniref:Uncharacterized protein LOC106078875 isoform X2 n=1 Tax=Biomphalaria glabrata TaxID=6526 RepID=A0A9W2Z3G5_BIOGL|nr:uncharacterized protein LOC106078875 isoform X2 [Biomphalaria glabrata]